MRILKFLLLSIIIFSCGVFTTVAASESAGNDVQWLGQSTCLITTASGTKILIDPWITGNPSCPIKKEDVKPDIILVTHEHLDHIGTDIPYFTKNANSLVVVHYDVAPKLISAGVETKNIITGGMGMNVGGLINVKGIKIIMTEAAHSANAAGYIMILEDGTTIYHAGDTGLFGGMKLLGDLYRLDLALLPIGSTFTMDPGQAAYSLTLLKPRAVIPIHYGSFDILIKDPSDFIKLSKKQAPNVKVITLNPGEKTTLYGR